MKLGLNLVRLRADHVPELARHAEELGYESVFVPDHLVMPVEFDSSYPGTPDGSFPYPRNTPLYDPIVVLAMTAQATTSIRLGTAIYLLPLRHPVVTARTVTTLDVLSGGRVILGVGVGWLTEEFEALGIDPRTRFGRAEEAATALRRLWTDAEPSFHGKHFDFGPVHFEPKPATTPHPPILFGGDSEPALRRALRAGDGWISGGTSDVDHVGHLVGRLRELRAELLETDPGVLDPDRPFDITVLHPAPSAHDLSRLEALGVDRLVVMPWERNRDAPEAIEAFRDLARDVASVDAGRPDNDNDNDNDNDETNDETNDPMAGSTT